MCVFCLWEKMREEGVGGARECQNSNYWDSGVHSACNKDLASPPLLKERQSRHESSQRFPSFSPLKTATNLSAIGQNGKKNVFLSCIISCSLSGQQTHLYSLTLEHSFQTKTFGDKKIGQTKNLSQRFASCHVTCDEWNSN